MCCRTGGGDGGAGPHACDDDAGVLRTAASNMKQESGIGLPLAGASAAVLLAGHDQAVTRTGWSPGTKVVEWFVNYNQEVVKFGRW
jgi:hypothetical protein